MDKKSHIYRSSRDYSIININDYIKIARFYLIRASLGVSSTDHPRKGNICNQVSFDPVKWAMGETQTHQYQEPMKGSQQIKTNV